MEVNGIRLLSHCRFVVENDTNGETKRLYVSSWSLRDTSSARKAERVALLMYKALCGNRPKLLAELGSYKKLYSRVRLVRLFGDDGVEEPATSCVLQEGYVLVTALARNRNVVFGSSKLVQKR